MLPIKAALMSALTLGSTMGVLTWMFVEGHGSGIMNYTPQPLMARITGNYKHGNERLAGEHPRNRR